MIKKSQDVQLPPVLPPWMEPVQQEIRHMVVRQRDADFLRSLGYRAKPPLPRYWTAPVAPGEPINIWLYSEAWEIGA